MAARPSAFDEVLVVDIDEACCMPHSTARARDRTVPTPRPRLLLEYLRRAGARAVAFDVVFDEARDGDELRSCNFAKRSDVVLGTADVLLRTPLMAGWTRAAE